VAAGVGVVALASNPLGWGILTILAAIGILIGITVTVWKLVQYLRKKVRGTKGRKRHMMAVRLYQKGALGGDPAGQKAIKALGLNPEKLKQAGLQGQARGKTESDKKAKTRFGRIHDLAKEQREHREKVALYQGKKKSAEIALATARGSQKSSLQTKLKKYEAVIKDFESRLALARGEQSWKALPKAERDVARLIFLKLGSK
jgi:hypothetical protein